MQTNLLVSEYPYISATNSTKKTMLMVIIALLPCVVMSIIAFGLQAIYLIVASVASCVLSELIFNLIAKKNLTVTDLSCVVTGLILALILPSTTPFYLVIVFGIFAIIVVKMLCGGIGKNLLNPAVTSKVLMLILFGFLVTRFQIGKNGLTMLETFKNGMFSQINLSDLFLLNKTGCLGEVSAIAILIGFAFLLLTKTIKWEMPVVFLACVGIFSVLFYWNIFAFIPSILVGGTLFSAVFVITDYSTSPLEIEKKIFYCMLIALLTVVFRKFGFYLEGVWFAIIIVNLINFVYNLVFRIASRQKFKTEVGTKEKSRIDEETNARKKIYDNLESVPTDENGNFLN